MNNNSNIVELKSFANTLADKSEIIIMEYFRQKLNIERKNDDTPVTIADKKSEEIIRSLINKQYPDHGIIGEEYEGKNIDSEYLWVIDPIDGTRSFIAGHKDFGTLIALIHKAKPILGIINCPAHKERWIGIDRMPTTLNGDIVNTSNIKHIDNSYTFTSGLYFEDKFFRKSFEKIIEKSNYYRFGGDCYMYGMLASGLIDIVVEDTLKIHDYMALIPVIEGAGGVVTDKKNQKITLQSDGSLLATANPELHKEVIGLMENS